jgi:hypothetical protein
MSAAGAAEAAADRDNNVRRDYSLQACFKLRGTGADINHLGCEFFHVFAKHVAFFAATIDRIRICKGRFTVRAFTPLRRSLAYPRNCGREHLYAIDRGLRVAHLAPSPRAFTSAIAEAPSKMFLLPPYKGGTQWGLWQFASYSGE